MTLKVKGLVRWLIGEPWPKCPRCLDAEPSTLQLPVYKDGDMDELECSNCGTHYEIRAHVHPTFDCYPKGGRP